MSGRINMQRPDIAVARRKESARSRRKRSKKKVEKQLAAAKVSRDYQPFLDDAGIASRRDIADAALQPSKLDTANTVANTETRHSGPRGRAPRGGEI